MLSYTLSLTQKVLKINFSEWLRCICIHKTNQMWCILQSADAVMLWEQKLCRPDLSWKVTIFISNFSQSQRHRIMRKSRPNRRRLYADLWSLFLGHWITGHNIYIWVRPPPQHMHRTELLLHACFPPQFLFSTWYHLSPHALEFICSDSVPPEYLPSTPQSPIVRSDTTQIYHLQSEKAL